MRRQTAAAVTFDDLSQYFSGKNWHVKVHEGKMDGWSPTRGIEVKLEPKGSIYSVSIKAYEDKSDADQTLTDNPMRFLVDFLKTGTPGDKAFENMASSFWREDYLSPTRMAEVLKNWADGVEKKRIGFKLLSKGLRHIGFMADIQSSVASQSDPGSGQMEELLQEMSKKGWRANLDKSDKGLPEITVDIAGVYEAHIEVDHILWNYEFTLVADEDVTDEGTTDDPIVAFDSFYKSEAVQSTRHALKSDKQKRLDSVDDEKTVGPSSSGN